MLDGSRNGDKGNGTHFLDEESMKTYRGRLGGNLPKAANSGKLQARLYVLRPIQDPTVTCETGGAT